MSTQITIKYLEKHGACEEGIEAFREAFPEGGDICEIFYAADKAGRSDFGSWLLSHAIKDGLTSLPENLKVGGGLYLNGCTGLTSLPENLKVGGYLDLRGCTNLKKAKK